MCVTSTSTRLDLSVLAPLADRLEEVSCVYAEQWGIDRTPQWFALKLVEEVGELVQVVLQLTAGGRTKGATHGLLRERLGREVADVVSHALLAARVFDIDVAKEITDKWLVWARD